MSQLDAVTEPELAAAGGGPPPRRRGLRALMGLTGVQLLQLAAGLITGPILARALGADGRGALAAVTVPIALAPFLAQIGTGAFAVNRTAQGTSPRTVFGSIAVPLLLIGVVGTLVAPTVADQLTGGDLPTTPYLTIGLALLPVGLLLNLMLDIAWGLSLWRVLILARVVTPAALLLATVVLAITGTLTVESAAIVAIATGFTPALALLPVARRIWRPQLSTRIMRDAMSFGVRAWPGTLASLANQRLDQLIMIPLVPSRELGLYAVAVTIASLAGILTNQVATVMLPRVAAGEHAIVPLATRCMLLVVFGTGVLIAVGTLLFLVPIFGADFSQARELVLVLLVANLAQAGVVIVGQSLTAAGRPGAPSVGEIASLAVTIPGLILFLPAYGALGAATVSLLAYSVTFALLVSIAVRHFHHRPLDYVLPRAADVQFLRDLASPILTKIARLASR